ncbi:MAG TPA: T9SS type A sorting domain-containing protein [Ignavibacteria bacterium]|nr:T9SS type A sorting domain-containing protein [Ignavibacteria bacterium]
MKLFSAFLWMFLMLLSGILHSQTYPVPDILYYKFNSGSTTTPNYAVPGEGNNPAPIIGNHTIGMTGQFDSALVGGGGTSSVSYVSTGWNMNFGTSSWTISMWINNIGTTTCYLFGNDITTSFRCFTNGAAGSGNITLRGVSTASFPNVDVLGVLPGPSVVHFVYDSATTTISKYVNGVFQSSVLMPALNLTAAVPFKVGGYGTANALGQGWLMDEFRVYRRALGAAEILATWNQTLPYTVTGISQQNNEIPVDYALQQNYPNPFNPVTTINYSIPAAGNVELGVFNMLGQQVAQLQNGFQQPGNYTAQFNAADLPSGVYMYRISSGNYSESKKMILVK